MCDIQTLTHNYGNIESHVNQLKVQLQKSRNTEKSYRLKLQALSNIRQKITQQIQSLTKNYTKQIKALQNRVKRLEQQNKQLRKQNNLYQMEIQTFQERIVQKEKTLTKILAKQFSYVNSSQIQSNNRYQQIPQFNAKLQGVEMVQINDKVSQNQKDAKIQCQIENEGAKQCQKQEVIQQEMYEERLGQTEQEYQQIIKNQHLIQPTQQTNIKTISVNPITYLPQNQNPQSNFTLPPSFILNHQDQNEYHPSFIKKTIPKPPAKSQQKRKQNIHRHHLDRKNPRIQRAFPAQQIFVQQQNQNVNTKQQIIQNEERNEHQQETENQNFIGSLQRQQRQVEYENIENIGNNEVKILKIIENEVVLPQASSEYFNREENFNVGGSLENNFEYGNQYEKNADQNETENINQQQPTLFQYFQKTEQDKAINDKQENKASPQFRQIVIQQPQLSSFKPQEHKNELNTETDFEFKPINKYNQYQIEELVQLSIPIRKAVPPPPGKKKTPNISNAPLKNKQNKHKIIPKYVQNPYDIETEPLNEEPMLNINQFTDFDKTNQQQSNYILKQLQNHISSVSKVKEEQFQNEWKVSEQDFKKDLNVELSQTIEKQKEEKKLIEKEKSSQQIHQDKQIQNTSVSSMTKSKRNKSTSRNQQSKLPQFQEESQVISISKANQNSFHTEDIQQSSNDFFSNLTRKSNDNLNFIKSKPYQSSPKPKPFHSNLTQHQQSNIHGFVDQSSIQQIEDTSMISNPIFPDQNQNFNENIDYDKKQRKNSKTQSNKQGNSKTLVPGPAGGKKMSKKKGKRQNIAILDPSAFV